MTGSVRKFALTAHVAASVGWLGAVATFLVLAISGLAADDGERARSAYLAMQSITWAVIVPLSFGSLITGLIQSLGTNWGVFRYYWVVAKLVLNVVSTAILLLHTQAIDLAARAASDGVALDGLRSVRVRLIADAGAALVALLLATALSVYKPLGLTPYGRRQRAEDTRNPQPTDALPTWAKAFGVLAVVLALVIVILHLTGHGFGPHQ